MGAEKGEWEGKGKGGEKEEEGDIGQKTDMSSDRLPFLCVSPGGQSSLQGHCSGRSQGGKPLPSLRLPWVEG